MTAHENKTTERPAIDNTEMRKSPQFNRIAKALWISLLVDFVFGILALLYDSRPDQHSAFARFLDALGVPAEAITMWLVPGHTLVQPLFDMATTCLLIFAMVWCLLWISGKVRGASP